MNPLIPSHQKPRRGAELSVGETALSVLGRACQPTHEPRARVTYRHRLDTKYLMHSAVGQFRLLRCAMSGPHMLRRPLRERTDRGLSEGILLQIEILLRPLSSNGTGKSCYQHIKAHINVAWIA